MSDFWIYGLFILGGFLLGGAVSLFPKTKPGAAIVGLLGVMAAAGGVLQLVGQS